MTVPKKESRLRQLKGLPSSRANRTITLFVAASMVAFAQTNVVAKAPNTPRDAQASAVLSGLSQDYVLAPGDRLAIVIYDQPQLSGDFIIDGGGGIVLPIIGPVSLKGLTLANAQQFIQQRLADGVLVQPAVSIGIKEHRPIFVTGNVRKPGSYPFIIGQSVKAAIAAAGGEGEPIDFNFNGAMSDYITAEQHVRQLESLHAILLMRKARLEAQRDGSGNFVAPMPVGLGRRSADFNSAYSTENDTLSRLADVYREQVATLQSQRPRIEAQIESVMKQITKQNERLAIVNSRLADLEGLFSKGLLRKDVLQNQQIEKSLVEGQISSLEAQVANLRQAMGDLDVRLGDVKAVYLRQALADLQSTSERLHEVEIGLAPARRLLRVKARGAAVGVDEADYLIRVSRVRDGGMITFDVTDEYMLLPGDVVDVKLKRPPSEPEASFSNEAIRELDLDSSVAEAKGQATSQ